MKRVLSLLVLAFSFALFTGCSDSKPTTKAPAGGGGGGTTQPTEKK